MKNLKRVVVTGMGALTPIGNTLETYWNALIAGKSGYITGMLSINEELRPMIRWVVVSPKLP